MIMKGLPYESASAFMSLSARGKANQTLNGTRRISLSASEYGDPACAGREGQSRDQYQIWYWSPVYHCFTRWGGYRNPHVPIDALPCGQLIES
jgi:hypothetical protein